MIWQRLVRFAGKPVPDQLMTVATKLRGAPHNIPYISAYFERRAKARLFGGLAPLVPAVKDMFDGAPGLKLCKVNGDEFLRICKEMCGLRPDERVLDVGCGIGRKALPLTQYLTTAGSYDGIDVTRTGIEWRSKQITSRFANFRFQHIDVYNRHYNPSGKCSAGEFTFPFSDEYFQFVVLWSVFTHVLPDDVGRYLSEIHRVSMDGGRCLITCFLLNQESLEMLGRGRGTPRFRHAAETYRAVSGEIPERAIAIDERFITERYQAVGLKIARVSYGSWCGRRGPSNYQDHILAFKA